MTARIFLFMFLVFAGLVFLNYLSIAAGNFFSYGIYAKADRPGPAQLAAINLDLFGKDAFLRSYVTQGYGRTFFSYAYKSNWHNGIDIAAVYGAPIHSPAAGVVVAAGNQDDYCPRRGFGRYVAVQDEANHVILWFAHLGEISVGTGDAIKKGAAVGTVGVSGFETGTHLHFSVFSDEGFSMQPRNGCGPDPTGKDLDPLSFLGTVYK